MELRDIAAGPLPEKSLVVYDPELRLPIDVFPYEDGHAQERSLLSAVLDTVQPNDLWIADRNFCTINFTCGITLALAYFIIREHKNYPWQPCGKEKYIGKIDTGKVYEQRIQVLDANGNKQTFRRIRLALKNETRDGDKEIAIITNLLKNSASAQELVVVLKMLAEKVKLSRFKKHPRGPKTPRPKRKSYKDKPHVSTAGIIADRKK